MKTLLFFPTLFLLSLPILLSRWSSERLGAAVTLCVDGAELEAFFPPAELPGALRRLSDAGVSSVAVRVEPGRLPVQALARWTPLLPPELDITLRPAFEKISEGGLPVRADALAAAGDRVRYLLPAGTALPFDGPESPLRAALSRTGWLFPYVEFSRSSSLASLAKAFPGRCIRAHSIDEEEMLKLSMPQASIRMLRAVRERGIRFLYVRLFPGATAEENLSHIERLSGLLRRSGFPPGSAAPPSRAFSSAAPAAFQCLAFALALVGPAMAFRAWVRLPAPWWARPALLAALALAVAAPVAAMLSFDEFRSGLYSFRGVKVVLALPLLAGAWTLYGAEERRSFLRRPLTVGGAALLAAAGLVAAVYLLRSGHDSGVGASAWELRVRDVLEALLGVRPRFKEFALGFPLLWLGCWMQAQKRTLFGMDHRAFLLAGFIAPLSIVNTFCHAHIPLDVSLLRTAHGFWLGAAGASALIFAAGRTRA